MRPRRPPSSQWTDPRLVAVGLLLAALVPGPSERPQSPPVGLDKLGHGVGHAVYAYSLLQALEPDTGRGSVPLVLGLSVGYSVLLERLQEHVPGRQFETGDVVASLVGSVVGVSLVRYAARR